MRQFKASEFAALFADLTEFLWCARNWNEEDDLTQQTIGRLKYFYAHAEHLTDELEFKASHDRLTGPFWLEISGGYGTPKWGRVKVQIQTLLETMQFEVVGRRFASVATSKSSFLDDILEEAARKPISLDAALMVRDIPSLGCPGKNPSQVWLTVWRSFPSLRKECEEAVYCYVLERNTACVFHSMRVAEIGLRSLARRMKVKMPKGKRLEWAEWQAVLKEMTDCTDKLGKTLKAGPAKDAILDFYSGAIGQFMGFKDEFRNQVMHVHRDYDEYEAASALTRIRDFMYKLAGEIDEKGRRVPR